MTSYLRIFTQIQDDLVAVGEIVDPMVLVRTTLKASPNLGGLLCEALCPRRPCPVGRDSRMTSYRRR
jgi:hypothetical protein